MFSLIASVSLGYASCPSCVVIGKYEIAVVILPSYGLPDSVMYPPFGKTIVVLSVTTVVPSDGTKVVTDLGRASTMSLIVSLPSTSATAAEFPKKLYFEALITVLSVGASSSKL